MTRSARPMYWMVGVAAVLALGGCKQLEEITKKPSEEATSASAAAVSPPPVAAASIAPAATQNVATEGNVVPTEEDFEEEAAEDITLDNLDSELDDLEKEITNT